MLWLAHGSLHCNCITLLPIVSADDDQEFNAVDEDDIDDEETLAEQESKEVDKVDHKEEIDNLEKEGKVP